MILRGGVIWVALEILALAILVRVQAPQHTTIFLVFTRFLRLAASRLGAEKGQISEYFPRSAWKIFYVLLLQNKVRADFFEKFGFLRQVGAGSHISERKKWILFQSPVAKRPYHKFLFNKV